LQPTAEWLTQPGGLAQRLRAMRKAAGLTGDQLAERLNWARSRIPKLENGHKMPSEQEIRAWVAACGQPDEVANQLVALLGQGQVVNKQWRQRLRHGAVAAQGEWDTLLRQASVIRNFEIVAIPGLLQTAEYARYRMFEAVRNYGVAEDDVDAAVAARLRRQEVLYEPGRRFEFVVLEAALRFGAAPAAVMIGQLDRLSVLSALPNITLGVIPLGVTLPTMPMNPFVIADDVAWLESHAPSRTARGDEADTYKRFADALMAEAATGDAARRLCMAAAEWWRAQQGQPG
jgi:transcriptional regulator with XRE-family HTH domain